MWSKEYRKQWQKEYYIKNKDKLLKQKKNYREENRQQIREKAAQKYIKNKEKIQKQGHDWYIKNKEKIQKQRNDFRDKNKEHCKIQRHESYVKHREKILKQTKEYYERNKKHLEEKRKEYYVKHRNEMRDKNLRYIFGISLCEYNNLFEKQNGCCAICGEHQNKFKRKLSVDHNHLTGKIRGLLCRYCNPLLGHANDDSTIIKNAIKYLEKNNQSNESMI